MQCERPRQETIASTSHLTQSLNATQQWWLCMKNLISVTKGWSFIFTNKGVMNHLLLQIVVCQKNKCLQF